MAPTKRKCCLTPAPCGHATAQIASKELDASWLSYVLGKWKGFQSYLNYYTAVLFTKVRIAQRTKLNNNKNNHSSYESS